MIKSVWVQSPRDSPVKLVVEKFCRFYFKDKSHYKDPKKFVKVVFLVVQEFKTHFLPLENPKDTLNGLIGAFVVILIINGVHLSKRSTRA